jgi:CheY-like chemotaxis protein
MARVLVVQGHARSRADTAATLRAEGHGVLEAGSADNGVRMAHEQGPEVILLDPMLPDRSGHEPYATLQRDPATLAIPVLFLAGDLGMGPVSVILADLDGVAEVNERHGYAVGDASCRPSPACCTSPAGPATPWPVPRPRRSCCSCPAPSSTPPGTWPSGSAAAPPSSPPPSAPMAPPSPPPSASPSTAPPDTWRDLLDRAETALTRAKRAGRSRCEVA